MKKIILLFFLSFCLINCKKESISNSKTEFEIPPPEVLVDTTDGTQYITIIQKDNSKINLSKNELKLIESLLRIGVEKYNIKQEIKLKDENLTKNEISEKSKRFIIDLKYYKRQYFPQIAENGDKLVNINCFCSVSDDDHWKTERIEVNDGGKCYFQSMVNLTKRKVIYLHTNGKA